MNNISVIIPTLNAGNELERAIESVNDIAMEIIVVDGGSKDDTVKIARKYGARVFRTERGRGLQLSEGALQAVGDWFLFLHADTVLGAGWPVEVASFLKKITDQNNVAGAFRFRLSEETRVGRILQILVFWRCRIFGLAWGDQGLFLSRKFYGELGGYNTTMPIFEDVNLIRRIGKRRLHLLETPAITSASKYRKDGYIRRICLNAGCLLAFFLKISPSLIERFYR